MPGIGTTGEINIYEVLMDKIREFREDLKDINRKIDGFVKEKTCDAKRTNLGQEMRQAVSDLQSLERRMKTVEGAQEEATSMTQDQVEAAVASGIRKANDESFWPKSFRDTLQTILFLCLLFGMVYTVYDHFATKRVEQEQLEKIVAQLERASEQRQPPGGRIP